LYDNTFINRYFCEILSLDFGVISGNDLSGVNDHPMSHMVLTTTNQR